ncbi:MAG: hypothetical protein UHD09_02255 [Bifidobacterium sp.]|nr:hypothetical protein [Bifidobacterium sp.]
MIHPNPEDPKAQVYCENCGLMLAAIQIATNQRICDECARDEAGTRQAEYMHDELDGDRW